MAPQDEQPVTEPITTIENEVDPEMEQTLEEEVPVNQDTADIPISDETTPVVNEDDIEAELDRFEKRATRFNLAFDREAHRARLLRKRASQQPSKPTGNTGVLQDNNQFVSRRRKLNGLANVSIDVDEETLAARRKRFGGQA